MLAPKINLPHPATTEALASAKPRHTYGQILKSSALIGGSSAFNNVALGIVRNKVMALLLGREGVGLFGLYGSVLDLTQSIAGMGINSSGVRQIAASASSGEAVRVARTATVLRRTSVVLGVLGAVLLLAASETISRWTFGSERFAVPVALLSLAVLFKSISAGQEALIQGLRRIADLAKIAVVGGLFGTVLSLGLVFWFREKGIAPALVAVAATGLAVSWWFRRRIRIDPPAMTATQVWREASSLLKLGSAFMASAILTMGAAYLIRVIVRQNISLEAAGLYQSAWALGGQYVGFILQAMGSDFYPRLTAAAQDNAECNRLVNEQAEVGLLLAGPGVLATLTFAPLVIALFYTREFTAAVEPLRWICLGMLLRVIAWPMGFIVLAKGVQSIFFWTEVVAASVHVGLAWIAVRHVGLAGAGMAFFGLYVVHGCLIYLIVRRLSGFRWSPANRRIGLLFLSVIAAVFCGFFLLPFWVATALGSAAAAASGIYSVRALVTLVSWERIPRGARRLLVLLRCAPPEVNSRSKSK